jgi:hypothetical protein
VLKRTRIVFESLSCNVEIGGVMVSTGVVVAWVASRDSISPQYGGQTIIENNEYALAA